MTTDLKLCKDCSHYVTAVRYHAECMHPKNRTTNLETGQHETTHFPRDLRGMMHKCGETGRWWEPKPEEKSLRWWLLEAIFRPTKSTGPK